MAADLGIIATDGKQHLGTGEMIPRDGERFRSQSPMALIGDDRFWLELDRAEMRTYVSFPVESKSLKVQATVYGHTAWVIEQIMVQKSEPMAVTTAYILQRWMDQNEAFLRDFKLTRADYAEFQAKEAGGEAEILNYPDKNA